MNDKLRLIFFSDTSFNTHPDHVSQITFLVLLVDEDKTCNILHYVSRRCKRVTRSVFAAELLALVEGLDVTSALADPLTEILGRKIPVWGCVDSRTVYNVVVLLGSLTEKRLSVGVAVLKEAYLSKLLDRLLWVPSQQNAANGFTKPNGHDAVFWEIFNENKLRLNPKSLG